MSIRKSFLHLANQRLKSSRKWQSRRTFFEFSQNLYFFSLSVSFWCPRILLSRKNNEIRVLRIFYQTTPKIQKIICKITQFSMLALSYIIAATYDICMELSYFKGFTALTRCKLYGITYTPLQHLYYFKIVNW